MPEAPPAQKTLNGGNRVDPGIWNSGNRRSRIRRRVQKLLEAAASLSAPAAIVVSPLIILVTIPTAYYLAGPVSVGPAVLLALGLFITGIVLIAEKTGHARNFQREDYSLMRQLAALAIACLVLVTLYYVLLYAWKP